MPRKAARVRCLVAVLALAVLALAGACQLAQAEDPALLPEGVGLSELYASDARSGLALGGWDPVSYQVDRAPRPGSERYELIWRGLGWRFSGEANRAAFLADPEAFAPRLGGYDAAAAAHGLAVAADPHLFAVLGGRLYLFRTAAGRDAFAASPSSRLRAEAAWAAGRSGLVKG